MPAPARLASGLVLALLLPGIAPSSADVAAPSAGRSLAEPSAVGPTDPLAEAWERDEQLLDFIVDRIEASVVTDGPTGSPTEVSSRRRGERLGFSSFPVD